MKICRITLDLAYEDSAENAPRTERTLRNLMAKVLDPQLGDYTMSSSGVLVKPSTFRIPRRRISTKNGRLGFARP